MLTKYDLLQIKSAVKEIVKEEIDPFKKSVEREFKLVKSQLRKLRKNLSVTIKIFDREYINLEGKVSRLEHKNNFSS